MAGGSIQNRCRLIGSNWLYFICLCRRYDRDYRNRAAFERFITVSWNF